MYRGVAIWNYAGDAVKNAERFLKEGFDAVSWNAPLFVNRYDDAQRERVGAYLRETNQYLTMHNLLPNPYDPSEIINARHEWSVIREWNDKYGLLKGMTFDFWHPHEDQLPLYRECMDFFHGQELFFACEDTPLNAHTMKKFEQYLKPEDDAGILMDIGHLNVRQWMIEEHEHDDFMRVFRQLPMKVRELHLHDNKGRKDEHREVGYGNLPMQAIADATKAIGFDGVVTVEVCNSQDWTLDEHIAHAIDTSNSYFSRI